ncbi:MAG: VWA domain-containing protein [Armatimonadetes bacterium]|nr:VWA domain-containing protein [Armatimonadota bacterium]
MKQGYTHMTVILDRTGSMESIRDDTIGGFNAFLAGQRSTEGTATITLVQFDSQDPFEVLYSFRNVADAPDLTRETYVPRASTPLLDALGRGMNDLDARLSAMDTADRPEHVLFVAITDGQENASREFRRADIARMMEERKERGWQFVFLSADMDAVAEAEALGVAECSRMAYQRSGRGVRAMYCSLDDKVSALRERRAPRVAFDEADRKQQEEEA